MMKKSEALDKKSAIQSDLYEDFNSKNYDSKDYYIEKYLKPKN
jgi:hypothetical protein